jgi:STE24 endopeptidase
VVNPLVILPVLFWLVWFETGRGEDPAGSIHASLVWTLAGGAAVVGLMRLWCGQIIRRAGESAFYRRTHRFYRALLVARVGLVAVFGWALFDLGLGSVVSERLLPESVAVFRLPGLIVATVPLLIGQIGLWWAAYPLERLGREQSVIEQVEDGLTVSMPPGLAVFILHNLRTHVLFAVLPILLALLVSDATATLLISLGLDVATWELAIVLVTAGVVFLLAPGLLVRVLATRPLDADARATLDDLPVVLNCRFRGPLLWDTQMSLGNAAVLGLVPAMRYVLITDLLVDRLHPTQLRAVLAHEIAHVRHGHVAWFLLMLISLVMVLSGPGVWLTDQVTVLGLSLVWADAATTLLLFGTFLLVFGAVSRRFERQADVYAARAVGRDLGSLDAGLDAVAMTLWRVAEVNHMSIGPRPLVRGVRGVIRLAQHRLTHFRHPSIAERVSFLRSMHDGQKLARFDRSAHRTVYAIIGAFVLCAGVLAGMWW